MRPRHFRFDEFKDPRYADWKRVRLAIEHENTLVNHRITWLLTSQGFIITVLGAAFNEAQKTEGMNFQNVGVLAALLSFISLLICRAISLSLRDADLQLNNLDKWWYRYWNNNNDWSALSDRSIPVSKSLKYHPDLQLRTKPKRFSVDFALVASILAWIWAGILLLSLYLSIAPYIPRTQDDYGLIQSSDIQKKIRLVTGINASMRKANPRTLGRNENIDHDSSTVLLREALKNTSHVSDSSDQVNERLYYELAKHDDKFLLEYAHSLNDQAVAIADEGKWQDALKLGLEALAVLRNNPSRDPGHANALASLTNNLGVFYSRVGKSVNSKHCFDDSFNYYQDLVKRNSLYQKELKTLLRTAEKELDIMYFGFPLSRATGSCGG